MCSGGGGGDGGAAAREAERQARVDAATAAVNSLFGIGDDAALAQRNQIYDTVRGDTRGYFSKQLEEDRAAAARELGFMKARSGQVGSSAATDLDTEFNRRYDRGLLDVANRAESAATGLRAADEQARLGLIGRVSAGMDQGSATSSALSQLQSNLDAARSNASYGRLANVFADLIGLNNMAQTQAGAEDARRMYEQNGQFGAFIPNNASYSGRVVK